MKLRDYMKEVVKECDDLFVDSGAVWVEQDVFNIVIGLTGNCNFGDWNEGWLHDNEQVFKEADMGAVNVQELFPEPKDFIKFYKKVIKEIENEH